MDELEQLEIELEEVERSTLEYLPKYGYSPKEEILQLIKEEIDKIKAERASNEFDYMDDELEYERTHLCMSLGISRYC